MFYLWGKSGCITQNIIRTFYHSGIYIYTYDSWSSVCIGSCSCNLCEIHQLDTITFGIYNAILFRYNVSCIHTVDICSFKPLTEPLNILILMSTKCCVFCVFPIIGICYIYTYICTYCTTCIRKVCHFIRTDTKEESVCLLYTYFVDFWLHVSVKKKFYFFFLVSRFNIVLYIGIIHTSGG